MLRNKYIYNADIQNSTFPAKISVYKITIFSFSQDYDEYEETCHKCTWFKYSNNETMKCDEFEDECEFGTGLKGKDYDKTFAFVGDKCFEHIEGSEYDENDTRGPSNASKFGGRRCPGCPRGSVDYG